MKIILSILLALCPLLGFADDKKNNSDPKYLAGAVTLDDDGKISFGTEIKVESISQPELYDLMLGWANERFKPEGELTSRVVYTDKAKGDIAVSAEEYVVFSSSALSLDRTRIYYQYLIHTEDGVCRMTMTRIRYWYDENRDGGQKYTAEEWITDDMALNKKKTKLAPICGKFRRETIDLKDALFKSASDIIRQHTLTNAANMIEANAMQVPARVSVSSANPSGELKDAKIEQLPANLNEIAEKGRITLTANEEEVEIKAENWGGFGKLFNKDVAYILVDQSKIAISALAEHAELYTVSFYMPGNAQASITISCKKAMSNEMTAEELKSLNQAIDPSKSYKMYIGEITGIQMR